MRVRVPSGPLGRKTPAKALAIPGMVTNTVAGLPNASRTSRQIGKAATSRALCLRVRLPPRVRKLP